jgi:hypothetical protein
MRPEFAAWRYGDQFGRRRKRAILYGAGAAAVFGGIMVGQAMTGVGIGFIGQIPSFWASRTLVKLRTDDGRVIKLNNQDLLGTRLRAADDEVGYRLEVRKRKKKTWFAGEEARRHAAVILPKINRRGGKRDVVQGAVAEIAYHGHPDAFLADVVSGDRFTDRKGVPGYVNKMPKPIQLALVEARAGLEGRRGDRGHLRQPPAAGGRRGLRAGAPQAGLAGPSSTAVA